ncbi:hypothetical protein [Gottfriedia acidiceleris]|uniref:hypothetical protein n=1 Tax=Gottfriedia acidiceleris TaxID=371036 RepID=UPI000B43A9F7|nr:hypothetical protein [Gottfriedia acidiceleris]
MMKVFSKKIILLVTSLMILLMISGALISLTYIPQKVKENQEKKKFIESHGYKLKEDKSF